MEKLVKAEAVAKYIGEDVRTVYRKAQNGIYPCYRTGKLVRFKISEIDNAMRGVGNAKKDGTRRRSVLAT